MAEIDLMAELDRMLRASPVLQGGVSEEVAVSFACPDREVCACPGARGLSPHQPGKPAAGTSALSLDNWRKMPTARDGDTAITKRCRPFAMLGGV